MSGRRRTSLSPSLFPFLAVLVCTLGTLILLLALVAQKAEQTAQQIAEAQDQTDVDALAAEQQWRLEQLTLIRGKQTGELEKRRSELAHVEDHLRRLREQLQQLQAETAAAANPTDVTTDRQAELDALRQQIEREKERVAQLRQQAPSKRPRVVIVPHKGPNGTERRPVYVECTADGIFLRPEDARIAALQLDGPLGPGNPLDAALRAVRGYWQQHDPKAPPPYPLLIVRPDGIQSYALARAAMSDWDDQFGYELVPADVELAFPKAQPDLRRQLDVAIRQAVVRQHAQLAAMPGRYGATQPLPTLSAAALARGGAGGPHGYGRGNRPTGRSKPAAAAPMSASSEVGDRQYGSAASAAGISGQAVRDFDDALRDTAAAIAAEGGPLGMDSAAGAVDPLDGLGRPAAGYLTAASGDPPAPDGGTASTLAASQAASSPNALSGPRDGSSDLALAAADGTAVAEARPGNQKESGSQSTAGSEGSAGASETGGNKAASAGARGSAASGNGGSSAAGQPSLRRDRANWALPDEMAGARGTAIVRSIQVTARADAFVMYGENGRGAPQVFAFTDGMVDRAAMQLAAAVQSRVQSWGLALPGGRWQPVLAVEVANDDAEMRYRQLRTLLTGSGLTLERR